MPSDPYARLSLELAANRRHVCPKLWWPMAQHIVRCAFAFFAHTVCRDLRPVFRQRNLIALFRFITADVHTLFLFTSGPSQRPLEAHHRVLFLPSCVGRCALVVQNFQIPALAHAKRICYKHARNRQRFIIYWRLRCRQISLVCRSSMPSSASRIASPAAVASSARRRIVSSRFCRRAPPF